MGRGRDVFMFLQFHLKLNFNLKNNNNCMHLQNKTFYKKIILKI